MIAARAPNHLGDGVMALPALQALAALGPLTIHAPRWGAELYADVEARVVPIGPIRADVAVLFAPSLRAAFEARASRVRIGTPTDFRTWLLTDPVPQRQHFSATCAALARAAGATPSGAPVYTRRGTPAPVERGHIGLNPLSRGGSTREWPHYRALADRLGSPVVFYAGPGEGSRLDSGPHTRVVGATLPDFAATLERCAVFVSNDSGAAHFARAVGVPTVVVHGSTAARNTGPSRALPLESPQPCWPCYRPDCAIGQPCLETPVSRVVDAVRACSPS